MCCLASRFNRKWAYLVEVCTYTLPQIASAIEQFIPNILDSYAVAVGELHRLRGPTGRLRTVDRELALEAAYKVQQGDARTLRIELQARGGTSTYRKQAVSYEKEHILRNLKAVESAVEGARPHSVIQRII
jgi:hypothetical protein